MDWQCAKCGTPVTLADTESISDATRRHSREAVHAWTGARRAIPNGPEQRWLTPSERADRSERSRVVGITAGDSSEPLDLGLPVSSRTRRGLLGTQRRRRTAKTADGGDVRGLGGIVLVLIVVLVIAIGVSAHSVGPGEVPGSVPSELPTVLYPEPEVSPSASYSPLSPESGGSPVPTPAPPLGSSDPADTHEPGEDSNTTDRHRDVRENGGYHDGNYDNDEEWHRENGNPDEYYDGNYDNDDDYHREYGSN